MSTHNSTVRSVAPSYPDAEPVGPHLVIDKTEWVPGRHPESHRGHAGQRGYRESFYRCVVCGAERLSKRDLPEECAAPG
ncbi:hypothetical protein ACFQMA_25300 [Halosimplex aquaticum]|uniref:Uncharacterized protein n=1 Tax=Halosimplex aquaticum TaxID=3026162 RepID=A0ABD5YBN0_9EURY